MKDCLILPCSNKKGETLATAYDLYQGALNTIAKSCDQTALFERFDIFFLSAKLGLINAKDTIAPYDTKMASDEFSQHAFAQKHKRSANALLKGYANNESRLYIVLYNNYQAAFDMMKLSAIKGFKTVYKSTGSRGVGEHRGRLKRIIQSNITTPAPKTIFRSGCSNINEFNGFLTANERVGTSLAYLNKKHVLSYITNELKAKHNIFVDNGLITAVNKNIPIDESDIFSQYKMIVSGVRSAQALSAVIPDNPFDEDEALAIVKRNKADIRFLAKRCRLILPIHNTKNITITEQAKRLMKVIGKVPVTLGVPCLNKGNNKWRMSTQDIESLFSLKHDDGKAVFTSVHFLGLSEVSKGGVYEERLTLAQMYGVEFSCDASRVTALFGNQEQCKRAGNKQIRDITEKQEAMELHNEYAPSIESYTIEDEWNDPLIIDEVNSLEVEEKISLWNSCYPSAKLDYDIDDVEGSLETFERCIEAYFYNFIEDVKYKLNGLFKQPFTKLQGSQLREEAITKLFLKCNEQRGQVQQVMCF